MIKSQLSLPDPFNGFGQPNIAGLKLVKSNSNPYGSNSKKPPGERTGSGQSLLRNIINYDGPIGLDNKHHSECRKIIKLFWRPH